jgi:uncharacterized protein YjbI with pentapeptide repeats
MENIEIIKQNLKSKSFSGKKVSKFLIVESKFVDCSFESMNIKDICFGAGTKKSTYVNCVFDNSIFSSNVPGIARFESCSFKNVTIKKLFGVEIELINCVFSGEFKQGNLVGVFRDVDGSTKRNEFQGNDFTNLEFLDVAFSDINLTLQKFSRDKGYSVITDVDLFLLKAKELINSIEDFKVFDSANKVISIIELESEGGNNQLFIDKNNFPKLLQEAASIVLSVNQ